ncbi:MAG: hypothetical protein ACR2P5_07920, partial [Gammaproteobacteria bacterium]
MPRIEELLNGKIADILNGMRRNWRVIAEETGVVRGSSERPDIVVWQESRPPVLIENEYFPARGVEEEAADRLGGIMKDGGEMVQTVIALRSPAELKLMDSRKLKNAAKAAEYDYALLTGKSPKDYSRFPKFGWLSGKLSDVADFVYRASIPADAVQKAVISLEHGVQSASKKMKDAIDFRADIPKKLAQLFKQEYGEGEQTRRMAMLIIINAFVFHHNLAGFQGIRPLSEMGRTVSGKINSVHLIDEWKKILQINYWPIFDIARRILVMTPLPVLHPFLHILHETAEQLIEEGVVRSHDLSGRVFQRLIADRKYLATFYTRPASATLLANLAVPESAPFAGGKWEKDAGEYRIADFACGTGTLLAAAYQRTAELHEKHGGNAKKTHADMMENALVGCDVMPAAVHLTASMLSGMYPAVKFNDTRLFTLVYGLTEKKKYSTGSLELLDEQSVLPVFDTAVAKQTGGGEKRAKTREIEWRTHNLVIMNPPFTRSTNHEGAHGEIPNPVWAGFGMSKQAQKALAARSAQLRKNTCAHGNAGIATDFIALADKMVCQDGVVALVLPLSAMAGESWKKVRAMWARDYAEICVISLALPQSEECSFSADTGMAEILFIGKRINGRNGAPRENPRGVFTVLTKRPESEIESVEFARAIKRAMRGKINKLEDGLIGATPVFAGKTEIGGIMNAPLPRAAVEPWGIARIRDLSLAQTVYGLIEGDLRLPRQLKNQTVNIPVCQFRKFAERGFLHRDIYAQLRLPGSKAKRGRGPFDILPLSEKTAPTYPCLWKHDAQRETRMVVAPDSRGEVIGKEAEDRALAIWQTAGRAHHNVDFQFNSQPLAVAMTEKASIGGTAWANIILKNSGQECAYALWGNSTLGLLLYWWWASKQQEGRGRISLSRLPTMPVLDLTALSSAQLAAARRGFNAIKTKEFLPFSRINEDSARAELDKIILIDVLGLPKTTLDGVKTLREKLSREPSI